MASVPSALPATRNGNPRSWISMSASNSAAASTLLLSDISGPPLPPGCGFVAGSSAPKQPQAPAIPPLPLPPPPARFAPTVAARSLSSSRGSAASSSSEPVFPPVAAGTSEVLATFHRDEMVGVAASVSTTAESKRPLRPLCSNNVNCVPAGLVAVAAATATVNANPKCVLDRSMASTVAPLDVKVLSESVDRRSKRWEEQHQQQQQQQTAAAEMEVVTAAPRSEVVKVQSARGVAPVLAPIAECAQLRIAEPRSIIEDLPYPKPRTIPVEAIAPSATAAATTAAATATAGDLGGRESRKLSNINFFKKYAVKPITPGKLSAAARAVTSGSNVTAVGEALQVAPSERSRRPGRIASIPALAPGTTDGSGASFTGPPPAAAATAAPPRRFVRRVAVPPLETAALPLPALADSPLELAEFTLLEPQLRVGADVAGGEAVDDTWAPEGLRRPEAPLDQHPSSQQQQQPLLGPHPERFAIDVVAFLSEDFGIPAVEVRRTLDFCASPERCSSSAAPTCVSTVLSPFTGDFVTLNDLPTVSPCTTVCSTQASAVAGSCLSACGDRGAAAAAATAAVAPRADATAAAVLRVATAPLALLLDAAQGEGPASDEGQDPSYVRIDFDDPSPVFDNEPSPPAVLDGTRVFPGGLSWMDASTAAARERSASVYRTGLGELCLLDLEDMESNGRDVTVALRDEIFAIVVQQQREEREALLLRAMRLQRAAGTPYPAAPKTQPASSEAEWQPPSPGFSDLVAHPATSTVAEANVWGGGLDVSLSRHASYVAVSSANGGGANASRGARLHGVDAAFDAITGVFALSAEERALHFSIAMAGPATHWLDRHADLAAACEACMSHLRRMARLLRRHLGCFTATAALKGGLFSREWRCRVAPWLHLDGLEAHRRGLIEAECAHFWPRPPAIARPAAKYEAYVPPPPPRDGAKHPRLRRAATAGSLGGAEPFAAESDVRQRRQSSVVVGSNGRVSLAALVALTTEADAADHASQEEPYGDSDIWCPARHCS